MSEDSKRPIKKPDWKGSVTPEVIYRLENLFEYTSPSEFRDHLIELYHSYIFHEHQSLPYNFKDISESMTIFLDLLKFTEDEFMSQHINSQYLKKELPKRAALKKKPQATRT